MTNGTMGIIELENCIVLLICFVLLFFYPIGILIECLTGKEIYYEESEEPLGDDSYEI